MLAGLGQNQKIKKVCAAIEWEQPEGTEGFTLKWAVLGGKSLYLTSFMDACCRGHQEISPMVPGTGVHGITMSGIHELHTVIAPLLMSPPQLHLHSVR